MARRTTTVSSDSLIDRLAAPLAPLADLIGRIGLASLFVWSGWGKVAGYAGASKFMASKGLPMVEVLLPLTIVIELLCSLGLVLGAWTRAAALVLFVWMIPVTFTFHAYWAVDITQKQAQRTHFMKNVAIAGALLVVFAMGAGTLSVDARRRGGR